MLYLLTQHSLWNRTHHPFLLFTCKRGEGVMNSDHECKLLSHEDQVHYWDRSLRRWDDKIARSGPESYTMDKHRDWIDIHNYGVSHFGIHPTEIPRDTIRFYVFHLRCAVTRRLMNYLRKYMLSTTTEMMEAFSKVVCKFWSDWNVLVWNLNRPFTSFVGMELLAFIKNLTVIVEFLKGNFCETEALNDLCNGLLLWKDITPFLVIVHITNVESYFFLNWMNSLTI